MNVRILVGAFAAALILGTAVLTPGGPRAQAQQAATVTVDVDPTCNTATSLGDADACISVAGAAGTSFQIDVTVATIPSGTAVTGFNYFLRFDDSRLQVKTKDHNFLLLSAGGDLVDVGESVPDTETPHTVAMADLAVGTSETGPLSGTLGRYTFEVKVNAPAGLATFSLASLGIFDEEGREVPLAGSLDGFVSVGQPCPTTLPPQERAPDGTSQSDGDGGGDGGNGGGNGDETPGDGASTDDTTPSLNSTPGAEDGDQTPGPDRTPGAEASPTPDADDTGNEDSDDDDGGLSIWVIVLIVLAIIALAAGGGWWWWSRRRHTSGT